MTVSLVRILFDSYTRQKSRVAWGTYKSEYFCMHYNDAEQGAIYFILDYIDDLLISLMC